MVQRLLRVLPVALLLCLFAAGPAQAALKTCKLSSSEQRRLGATYVTRLAVQGMSCTTGKRVVRSYHRCRRARGGVKGRCPRVSGLRCTETRRRSISTQFSTTATCRSGSRIARFSYTQFT